jgi:predicted DNA-binding transcriptional regulator AlpA
VRADIEQSVVELRYEPIAVDQATMARMLGVSDKTFRDWCALGDVPTFKRGNVVRYPIADVRKWMSDRSTREAQ